MTIAPGFRLADQGIVIRDFLGTDVDDVLAIIGDNRVTDWLSFDARSREDAERMISNALRSQPLQPRTEFYCAVTDKRDERQVVGFVRLALGQQHAAKLGYATRFDCWGQGYASRAVNVLLDYGFSRLNLHRVTAAIGPDNTSSISIIERAGFHFEGTLREHVFTNGSWRDSLLYSRLAYD